jgi:hypothetical protein
MLFTIGGCNAGWHSIRTSAGYSDFDPPGASQADAALEKSRLGKLCVTNKTRHPISTSSAFFFVATCFLRTATIFCPGLGKTDNSSARTRLMKPCLSLLSPKCDNNTMKKCIFESSLKNTEAQQGESKALSVFYRT